ncbi:MAG TPA: hypothetical protein VEI97_06380, partial [bacterium]|nr:hypothetical protein [bacterium]
MNALALTLLGILLSVAVRSQPTLIRTFTSASYGNVIRLVATPDGGWAVYSPDSLSLAKFNRCGIREWSRHYDIGSARTQSTLEEIISLPGGFALLSRVETGGVHAALVIRLDDGGNVLWSKTYGDPFYSLYPYTLLLDPRGNLVITANAAPTSQGGSGMMVARVDPRTGALVAGWIHNIGNIWGGAVVTSDGGL